ncbi:MAG: YlbF family regulator [Acidaminococcaceae bacterium]
MNVYDVANDLAKAMRESQEFKRMAEVKTTLAADKSAEELVKDFNAQRRELEMAQLTGQEPDKTKIEKVQKLYEVLSLNKTAVEYIQAEMRFQMLLNDISKTIGDVVKEAVGE